MGEIVSSDAYATASDFEKIFTEDMSALYLLSFLLVGNQEKAEECFVTAIGESTKGNRVFKEWARYWARRKVVQSAIRLVVAQAHTRLAVRDSAFSRAMSYVPLPLRAEVRAILDLESFERFVFVMSALEGYSDHDCSLLLNRSRKEVIAARGRALQNLGTSINIRRAEAGASSEYSGMPETARPLIDTDMTIARYFVSQGWNRSLSP